MVWIWSSSEAAVCAPWKESSHPGIWEDWTDCGGGLQGTGDGSVRDQVNKTSWDMGGLDGLWRRVAGDWGWMC